MSKLKIRNGAYFSRLSTVEHSRRFSTLNKNSTLVYIENLPVKYLLDSYFQLTTRYHASWRDNLVSAWWNFKPSHGHNLLGQKVKA